MGAPGDNLPPQVRAVTDRVETRFSGARDRWARWRDPRATLLRRRRAAGAAGIGLGSVTGASVFTTAGFVVASLPEWTWVIGGGVTTLWAVPTVVAVTYWHRLRRTPLPQARFPSGPRPGRASATRAPLARLEGAGRSLRELTGVLERDGRVPEEDLSEMRVAAGRAVVVLQREASEIGALERAAAASPAAAPALHTAVSRGLHSLEEGVVGYESLVRSAAGAVSRLGATTAVELVDATDRVDALSAALTELAELHELPPTRASGAVQP